MADGKITWTNEKRKLSELIPWPRNPRQIKSDQAKRLVESFDEFGQVETIAIGPGAEVYNGHQRLNVLASKYGKDYEVEVRVASRPLSEKEREKLTVFLHKGAAGDWDYDTLANEFELDDLLEWGFEKKELDLDLWAGPAQDDPGAQMDKAEELREKWGVESGQLWQLGEHRLICGDCTDKVVVERVMGGEKADMIFTDPPYNVNYGTFKGEKFKQRPIENDSMSSDEYKEFCKSFLTTFGDICDGCYYVCHAPNQDGRIIATVLDNLYHCSTTIIWNKDTFTLGRGKYQNKYEPIWFGWNKDGNGFVCDDRAITNVWDIPRPKDSEEHPTMKPVDLVERAVGHASIIGMVVYDPFLGSGTTLIACERLGRKCRACEISPGYVAVALQRFYDMTGVMPELVTE